MSQGLESKALWEDEPVDISQEANFIWSIANKLRGVYMPEKYGDVIIPHDLAVYLPTRLMLIHYHSHFL